MAASIEDTVVSIIEQRARQLRVPLKRRQVTVLKKLDSDVHVNKHEMFIRLGFVLEHEDPTEPIDQLLKAVENFDRRLYEERVRKINEVKSSVMRWMEYLGRALPPQQYEEFVRSFLPKDTITLEPDEEVMENLLILEGQYYQDRGIHYAP